MKFTIASAVVAVSFFAAGAQAATLNLDGYTSAVQGVTVSSSPVAGTPGSVGATGFNITDTSGDMGSFAAWCVDIGHRLMSIGSSQEYVGTDTPFSNSYALTDTAISRIQTLFDANYATLDVTNGDQAAAFQMALWESAFESASNATNVLDGLFAATSTGSTALANTFLANAAAYSGSKQWNLSFLELADLGADRAFATGQNLVTVSPVPLPAAGLLLAAALAGTGFVSRRRRHAA